MQKYIKYLFYIPITLFATILLTRLIDLSSIITLFPSYDFSAHLTHLYFLEEYGFHNIAYNWYNIYGGEVVLQVYPPLLFFYSLILYSLINNLQLSFYISLIGIIIIGFIGVMLLGKVLNFSYVKRLFLFFFFYANPITIPWFYINGRIPEMLSWTLSFYLLALIFYYKEIKLDNKFYILSPIILSLIFLSHPLIFALFFLLFLGFFFIRENKEKIKIIMSSLFVPIITSFWLIGFLNGYGILRDYQPSYRLYSHPAEILYSILLPLAFFFILYMFIKIKRLQKKEMIFYLLTIFIALIYLTGLFLFTPILKSIEPRSYGIFLLLMSLILIMSLKLKTNKFTNLVKYATVIVLSLLAIFSLIHYDKINFTLYNEKNKDILILLPNVKNSFIVIGENNYDMHHVASLGAVKYNLTTPFGWGMREVQEEVRQDKVKLKLAIENKNCRELKTTLEKLRVNELIVYKDKCEFLKNCGLINKNKTNNYCHLINT